MGEILSVRELTRLLETTTGAESASVATGDHACLVVDLDSGRFQGDIALNQPACTVIGFTRTTSAPVPSVVDVIAAGDAELEQLSGSARANPFAACTLMQVLRHNAVASVADGLLLESLAYSTLQHGAEFQRWLTTRQPPKLPSADSNADDLVLLDRRDHELTLTLNRPSHHNAYSAAMRDALCAALELPLNDRAVQTVIRGAGRSFSAGGDLTEFGAARDAALAHVTRTTRSAGALLYRLRDRVTCHLHGACIGAGIELPAFARHVTATDDAFFQLPELAMGLIPGAGGTVSLPNRIGRQRTAFLALSNQRVDARTALSWGLVDEVVRR